MGYSIYLTATSREKRLIEEVVAPILANFKPTAFVGLYLQEAENLGYCEHKSALGFNYSMHDYTLYAVINLLARLLGKKYYWYDGYEKCPVQDKMWWETAKGRQESDLRRWTWDADKVRLQKATALCKKIEKAWAVTGSAFDKKS